MIAGTMRLNPEQLLTFAAVVREGGVGAAARQLHLSQPAVSNQLKKLQETVGEALYRRAGRGIALTGAGQRLYLEARRLADALSAATALAESLSGAQSGLIRITASQTLGAYLLPPVLAAFRDQAPGIAIELASYNSREVVDRLQDCDLGLLEGPLSVPLPDDRRAETIAKDEIVAVLPRDHPLATRRYLTPAQLGAEPLIWREEGSGTREEVERAFQAAGIVPQAHIALAGIAAIKEAVRQGLGIGFASRLVLRHDSGRLVGIALRPRLERNLTLIAPRSAAPATARFIEFLREQLAEADDLDR